MSTLPSDKKQLVDYGVQIRFINDLHDTGGGYSEKSRASNSAILSNKYGVAVRVQGISGQPYVVLKDGSKGDSYGVQLNGPNPSSGPPSPYDSFPKSRDRVDLPNPYGPVAKTASSPAPPAEDEVQEIFGSPLKRPPGDGQAGTQVEEEGGAVRGGQVERMKPEPQLKAKEMETRLTEWSRKDEEYNEAGLKPVKLTGAGSRGVNQNGADSLLESFPDPPTPVSKDEVPAPAIDTNSLAPINKLISKFNSGSPGGGTQTRGRSGARQRLKFDQQRRSRSLDARQEVKAPSPVSPPSSLSSILNPYGLCHSLSAFSNSLTSSASVSGSLKRSPVSVSKVTGHEALKMSFKSPGTFVTKDTPPAVVKKPEIPQKSPSKNNEVMLQEEAQTKQVIYNILKEGTSESEGSLKRKTDLVYKATNNHKDSLLHPPQAYTLCLCACARAQKGGSDRTLNDEKLQDLQKHLSHLKIELQLVISPGICLIACQVDEFGVCGGDYVCRLSEERMARVSSESRLHHQEDQLAELQDQLRRVSGISPHTDSLQTDVMTLQAELAEAVLLRQRQEETLRQRERELTALKGALKEEVECHDKEMEALREQYSHDMENLRKTMEQVTQSQEQIEEEREKVNVSMVSLEEELQTCRNQGVEWKTDLEATTQELQDTRQELLNACLEKEKIEEALKELQDSQSATKKQIPASDVNLSSLKKELQRCHDDLKQARTDLDKQKAELDEKREALVALKKASGEREAELLSEISRLKEQKHQEELEKSSEKIKESSPGSSGRTVVDHGTVELQEANTRLRERLARMRHSSVSRSSEAEETVEALEDENRSLKSQLEEAKRGTGRLSKEMDELTRRLEERDLEREALRRGKTDLEEQKRLLDRALEKINKDMEIMMGDSRQSVSALQAQLDDYRERSRKDLLEAQRNNKDRLAELQRVQNNLKSQQEEVSRLKKELLVCVEDRDSAQLERDLLNNHLKHLEEELESEKSVHNDRSREVRGLEEKIKALEMELDEERSSVELLNDRVSRSRDQVDQLRTELMQERSARHDLEMDKSSLERQMASKGDSYGVQLNGPNPSSGPPSPYDSFPKSRDRVDLPNPYGPVAKTASSPAPPAEDEVQEIFGSPLKRPPDPPTPVSKDEVPAPAIDTNSLAPINKLISKFNSGSPGGGTQTRGRSGARQRLKFDQQRRSRSLDARQEVKAPSPVSPPSSLSSILNPYVTPVTPFSAFSNSLTSSASVSGSLKRSPVSVSKVTGHEALKMSFKSPGTFVTKDTPPAVVKKPKGGSDRTLNDEKLQDLQKHLSHLKIELQLAHDELSEERMARVSSESRLHHQEDQLAELQDQLRRVSGISPHTDSLQTDVMTLQAELAEAVLLRQRQEETLRQRERELTALKGALKEEVECHDKEMEALREQYSHDMENLRKTMEQVTQSQEQIEEEREKVNVSMVSLEEELQTCRNQGVEWKTDLEKEKIEEALNGASGFSVSHKKTIPASDVNLSSLKKELQRCHDDLKQARTDLDKQKAELDEKREALVALKKASGEREAELLSEISRLKEQKHQEELEKSSEKIKESSPGSSGRTVVDHGTVELQEANTRLRERLARMTKRHSSVSRSSEAEETVEALEDENRSLKSQLEEAKRGTGRLSKEMDELTRRLEERDLEREALRRGKTDLEEQKRLLDRALEKINKEMEIMMGDSRQSVSALQAQLDDYRERSRKDLLEAQRNNKDRLAELQRVQNNLKSQQEEVSRLKKELLVCVEDRDSAQLERDLLNNHLKHLEEELESEKSVHNDRSREVRGLEEKIKALEMELDEERSSVELLNDRVSRSRDQVDQLRTELMQERSARHDLEMDKSSLERQVKELKSRIADMEGQSRPSPGLSLLENKIQELEERLHSEEREKASIQSSHRRMERKLKELNATLDQERNQHIEQKDQLSLRVKALKRQVDESEGEVERLEGVRRKIIRDLEEQQELKEALQAKVAALEAELKRRMQQTHRSAVGASTFSSDDEDSLYDTNITSILNESHLQTTSC
ncbi:LOW QUALITY PROTEIN: cingulin [Thalassophryne amazonica]|uniref:LOW QUALITY PROTEIN: cingulin n=1 Tax=Thalassophryne amazonica TaxID=390379 RepID=UPI001470FB26|nr:LOW QUALITY PROTEIN: cingulin [Thalassophryne amazonica]